LLERLVASQLLNYLTCNNLLPENQSAYRAKHSDETATVKISDITALDLLDCSVAFDTMDHNILLRKLSESFGVDDTALDF